MAETPSLPAPKAKKCSKVATNLIDENDEKLKQKYLDALDEISALMETVSKLQGQLDKSTRPRFISPVSLQLKDSTTFDKQVLSLGMYGEVEEGPSNLVHRRIQTKFSGNDAHGEKLEFLSKFPFLILEDVRHRIRQSLESIDNINGVVARVKCAPSVNGAKDTANQTSKKNISKSKQQPNFDFVPIECHTKECDFPKLEHGFNMELLCVMLPNYKKGKKANFVLAIGNREPNIDDIEDKDPHREREVHYTIRMLAHDYAMLQEHASNVFRRNHPNKEVVDPLKHVEWHHLMGLIPDARMYEATRPDAPFLFPEQILQHKPVPWPEPAQPMEYSGLNPVQARVVQSMAHTTARGMFHLIGPPGTGKTTTITQLLLERVRRFPQERILLTAPSNKAIQVVLRRFVESNHKNGHAVSIAVIGSNKLAFPEHEPLYASVEPLIARFKRLRHRYHNVSAVFAVKRELENLARDIVDRISDLLSAPGLRVGFDPDNDNDDGEEFDEEEQQTVDALCALQDKFRTESIQHLWEEEPLHKHIATCIARLSQAAVDFENYTLRKAQIVFSTLVASGRKSLHRIVKTFDTVIVDEASQALMPATFIPFMYNPARYVLVGDPQQLPATVQAEHLKPLGYADSLMLVMQREMGDTSCAMMLTTQYRMHPAICRPISDLFYGGKLTTDNSVVNRQCLLTKHLPKDTLLRALPSAFVDLDSVECRVGDGSIFNTDEAALVVAVAMFLLDHGVEPMQIGIVSGYSAQVSLLKSLLVKEERLRPRRIDLSKLAVSTVDGFQGDEKDFMLFSCVRTGASVGFLSDARRINVAMSRGRHANWVFGQARTLRDVKSSIRDYLSWSADPAQNCAAPFTRTIPAEDLLKSMEPLRTPAPVLSTPAAVVRVDREEARPASPAHPTSTWDAGLEAYKARQQRRQEPFISPLYNNNHHPHHEERQPYHQPPPPRYQQQEHREQRAPPPLPPPPPPPPIPAHRYNNRADDFAPSNGSRARTAPLLQAPPPSRISHYAAPDVREDGPKLCLQDPMLNNGRRKTTRNENNAGARNNKRNAHHLDSNEPRQSYKRPHIVFQESFY